MHSGMRGCPHVGAFRRCSFTKTESDSNRSYRASPASRLLVSVQQALRVTQFPSVLQLLPEFSGRPSTKLIPSQETQRQDRAVKLPVWTNPGPSGNIKSNRPPAYERTKSGSGTHGTDPAARSLQGPLSRPDHLRHSDDITGLSVRTACPLDVVRADGVCQNHGCAAPLFGHTARHFTLRLFSGGIGVVGNWFHYGPTLGKGVVAHLFLELAHHGSVCFVWHCSYRKRWRTQPPAERPTIRRCLRQQWAW